MSLGHISKRTPLIIADHFPDTRPLFLVFFLTTGLFSILLSAAQIVKYHEISKGIALFGAGVLAILSAAVFVYTPQLCTFATRPWFTRSALAVVALPWLVWTGLIAYTHHVVGWDEGAYMLSGLALRGYHVPYASHRAPVTGFLCAAFIGWDRFLNPVLLGVLLIAVYLWVRHLLGPLVASLSLVVVLCQNILLESTVDIMSELPAALLLLVGFYSLARERFWWSALGFALAVFSRWNLAPVWVVVFVAVTIRFGMRQALKFLGIGVAAFSVWYWVTVAMGAPNPLLRVYEGNFLPGLAWSATPDHRPDFLLRADFYVKHFFFLTPPILFSLIASPVQNLRRHLHPQSWVILLVLPLALLAYLITMLNLGGLFPRFVAPLIPSAVVSLIFWLSKWVQKHIVQEVDQIRVITLVLFLTCAVGLWPLNAVVLARANHKTPSVFSAELRKKLTAISRESSMYGVPREPLSRASGQPAMVEARHLILIPFARRDFNGNIIEEPDSIQLVRRLAAASHSGDLLLIPTKYTSEFQAVAVLFSDGQWTLMRNP
jgi:hypothetical protein